MYSELAETRPAPKKTTKARAKVKATNGKPKKATKATSKKKKK